MGAVVALLRLLIPATLLAVFGFWLYQRITGSKAATGQLPRPFAGPKVIPFKRSPLKVLGLEEGASEFEIEAAFRRLKKENDPETLADASPEIREFARQRMAEIRVAYKAIKEEQSDAETETSE